MSSIDGGDWREELRRLDVGVYAAIAATPTPQLDRVFRRVSRAADHSKLWLASAAVLAAAGGRQGRRAAVDGVASVAMTSAVVNLVLKPLGARRRPDRELHDVPVTRQVAMPRSTSFPSGHAASAFAFATGVAADLPPPAFRSARRRRWSRTRACTPACTIPPTSSPARWPEGRSPR